jgi:hypothetical protein
VLCRNHHADRTFQQKLEPLGGENPKNAFEVIRRWLLGIAVYLELLLEKLWVFGEFLIEYARQGNGGEFSLPRDD